MTYTALPLSPDASCLEPLIFYANGTQRNVTLSASSVSSSSGGVTGVNINDARLGTWDEYFYTSSTDAFQWFQVRTSSQPLPVRGTMCSESCCRWESEASIPPEEH